MGYPRLNNEPGIRDIWKAKARISSIVQRTPLLYSYALSDKIGRPVYLKLENVHDIGAFKVRGAANKILSLKDEEKKRGVATFSTGNHGMAVAYVAKKLGIEAVVCISKFVPKAKVERLKQMDANIEIYGESQDEAGERCAELAKKHGFTIIPPFDDPYIISGQGTIGLEIIEDLPDVSDVVIPLSGGGLFSGIGLALKSIHPGIKVTGVSMNHSAVMYESLKAGKPLELKEQETLADSLLGGIGFDNQFTFPMVKKYMDAIHLIPEQEISDSMLFMMETHKMIIEGAAATSIAAIIGNKIAYQTGAVVAIISGNNVDFSVIQQLLDKR